MNTMAILIATAFSVLVLGAMNVPETASAQYLGHGLEKEDGMAKEDTVKSLVVCAAEGCKERMRYRLIIEQLEELRLPEEQQKLRHIEERLVKLRQNVQLLGEDSKRGIPSLDEQAETLLLVKRIELRLYDITYENKFLIVGVAVAVSGTVLVWRIGGKSIDKNR